MKKYILILFILIHAKAFSQVPEDALRYSWYSQTGTARNMAIGGAMGSLGGDISATFINPAGLGFYRTRELVFSPGIMFNNNRSNFRDMLTSKKSNTLNLGATGFIFASSDGVKSLNSSALAFCVNQSVNFNNTIHYKGYNNYSSFSEQFAEEFAKSNLSIDTVLNINSPLPYTSAVALQTFLIDTATVNGQTIIKGAPEYILDSGMALHQDMYKKTGGGVYDLSIAYAHNIKDKILWGITLGIPVVDYKSTTIFTETDTSSHVYNHFKSFTYQDDFTTSGVGFNLKLGVIYKPRDYIRLGLAVHTPTYMLLTDKRTTKLTTNLETPTGLPESFTIGSETFTNNQAGENKYTQTSPWKAIISASYVFREVENVKKQRGFITADIEYVHHKGSRFKADNDENTASQKSYYRSLNTAVKHEYKGAFNFRVGGELKFNIIMVRLGFAYYGTPYKNVSQYDYKPSKMLLSGGLGYRNKGYFVDLTYVHRVQKDISFPYRLEDRANTFAKLDQKQGNVVVTVGMKF